MPDPDNLIIADSSTLQNALTEIIRDSMLEHVPDAMREARKAKWLHRDEVKERYGLTDRQLQYLRDNNKVTYSQHGRRIWYLRESVEEYFEEGRVESNE